MNSLIDKSTLIQEIREYLNFKYEERIFPCNSLSIEEIESIVEDCPNSYDVNKAIHRVETYLQSKYGLKNTGVDKVLKRFCKPKVLNCLKIGNENAVSLEYLSNILGINERAVREEINRINTSGEEIICNDGNGKGYYIAATLEEAQAYRNYNRSYWQSGIEKDKGIARCMKRRFADVL